MDDINFIAEDFPDDQQLTVISIKYVLKEKTDQEYIIENTKLNDKSFFVQERNITSILSSTSLNDPHHAENAFTSNIQKGYLILS